MTFMPWTDDLAVGIAEIDQQHHWLLDRTNELFDCLAQDEPDHGQVGELLESLVDYTVNHFVAEEELLQRHVYPEFSAHKAQHDSFTASLMAMLHRHEEGDVSGVEALDLLVNWLLDHIVRVDQEYVPHLHERGVV